MKSDNQLLYYLGFSYCLGIGPMKFTSLKSYFGTAKNAYLANRKNLEKILGFKLTEKFIEFRRKFDPIKELEKLNKDKIRVLKVDSKEYPESLKNISDPPICLYMKGSTRWSTPTTYFAIVGTRKPTAYGIQITKKFTRELVEAGFIIVSGMALGIDTISHEETIDNGGKTVAVLGSGVNVIYPSSNYRLYNKIIKTGGMVISEFPPNQFVLKGLFISRNRIISGLSRGVLVTEGGEFSGALITAKFAGIQGKDVFAIPSPINSQMAPAPNLLIKQGARMVTSTQDILDEFGMLVTPKRKEDIRKKLNNLEKLIFDILIKSPQTVDYLALELNQTASQILNVVSLMEINGIIEKNIEKYYQIKI
ncbi:MAG: DNA-processing protein DprA [Patescibacteria group bacterium]